MRRILVTAIITAVAALSTSLAQNSAQRTKEAPRFWNDKELSDWATPVVGVNVRPSHYSEAEYYAAPELELVRTYPVYAPGKEPAGYWEMIQKAKPQPLLTPGPRTEAEWRSEGKRVFHELDVPFVRNYDPKVIAFFRSEEFRKIDGLALKDGTIPVIRWATTSKGLAITIQECASCHSHIMPDGTILDGAPLNPPPTVNAVGGVLFSPERQAEILQEVSPGDTPAMALYRQFGVPWLKDDVNERLKTMALQDQAKFGAPPNVIARFNGSPFYPTKTPDLIGIRDRKFIDHTATHQLRGISDVMRYSALVTCCDIADFGSHRMLSDAGRRIIGRFSDDVVFALVQYIFTLEPPENPNANDARAAQGKRIFDQEGCAQCHTPPLYTNNKLTPAEGFTPPANHPYAADIMKVSVGTDPNLALKTRKGTGFYKVPSLKGVWYRGSYGHDGSVNTLEEWFDPARLQDDFVPSGFKGYEITHRAVPGHRFGLELTKEDRAALIAFLKTL
jgi:mono/diheme cytochrome c family protein